MFRFLGLGFRVSDNSQGSEFWVLGFWVWGLGFDYGHCRSIYEGHDLEDLL